MTPGTLEVIAGCMYAGKTEELQRRIRRAAIARIPTQVFTHSLDVRHGSGVTGTHDAVLQPAVPVSSVSELRSRIEAETELIAVDEAQFFGSDLANACEALVSSGLDVLVAGLDLDFRGRPFGPMPALLALADRVTKLAAICTTCGAPATRSLRIQGGDELVLVGGQERYEARCRAHAAHAIGEGD